jgi:chromosome partitioning protein
MTRIISVVNQKGGVGKTTTVINIGAALAQLDKKVLLIDFDPQGNLSAGLGVTAEDILDKNAYSALVGVGTLFQNVVATTVKNLFVVPSDSNLAGAEIELVDVERREYRLKESLTEDLQVFDYILLDCPPSLGLLTLNALCASDSYLIPLQSEFFALQGLTNILKTAELVKSHLNPDLQEEGILMTMYDSRSNLSKQVYNEIRSFAADRLFGNVIPRRVRLAESTSHGLPGVFYDPTCFGSRSYVEVAKEILLRAQGKRIEGPAQSVIPPDPVDRIGRGPSPEPAL